jgi:hypothetical protein
LAMGQAAIQARGESMTATNRSIAFSSEITHVGSGASIAAAGISGGGDISTALVGSGNLARYDACDVALMLTATASIAAASTNIELYRRDLNFDGTNDAVVPGASNLQKLVGVFQLPAATTASTTHYVQCNNVRLSGGDCEFYIKNATAVNVLAGWTLKVTPKTDSYA